MRVAVVADGVVVNVLVAGSLGMFAADPWPAVFPGCTFHDAGESVSPGWLFVDGVFLPPA